MASQIVRGDLGWSTVADISLGERDTADPLGFRAVANRVAADLVPVVTQTISSVRGFSLLCLGLNPRTQPPTEPDERFLRVERLYMAAVVQPGVALGVPELSGTRAARGLVRGDKCSLNRPILSNQMSSGVWGSYSRAAREIGLITGGSRPRNTHLTKIGKELADALREVSIKGEQQPLGRAITRSSNKTRQWIDVKQLARITKRLKPVTKRELQIVSAGFSSLDHSDRLHRLQKQKGHLEIPKLDPTKLTHEQQSAWAAADALLELIERLEGPYRKWVVGETPDSSIPKPTKALWDACAAWDTDNSLRRLRSQFSSNNTASGLHEWHLQLMTERGSTPWEVGIHDEERGKYTPPDFRLGALHGLFEEGLEIRP